MAEGTVLKFCDFMVVSPVLACGAEPGVEVKERLSRGNAHRIVSVTAGARGHPRVCVCDTSQ